MILYDNDNNLIGISRDTLNFLGYEDMEEFKTYASDVADLFVAKSGYVYKFNNFSWIDYVLHSGAANKCAIIKLKNGKEVETEVVIREILLLNSSKEFFYSVELKSLIHKIQASTEDVQSLLIPEDKLKEEIFTSPKIDEPSQNLSIPKEEAFSIEEEQIKEPEEENKEDILPEFLAEEQTQEDTSLSLLLGEEPKEELPQQIDEDKEDVVSFGIKDENILEPQSSFAKKEEGFTVDINESKEEFKDGFVAEEKDEYIFFGNTTDEDTGFEVKSEEENPEEDFLKAHALPKKEKQEELEPLETKPGKEYSFQKSVEFLGISEDVVKGYAKECLIYADELDEKLADYVKSKDAKNICQIVIQLKSLTGILCMEDLYESLSLLYERCEDEGEKLYDEYKEKLENIKRIEI